MTKYQRKHHTPYSLYHTLNDYGFTNVAQKKALENLFKQASIIPHNQSLKSMFPPRKTPQQLVSDILIMVHKTQHTFVLRTNTQERWDVAPASWVIKNSEQNYAYLTLLGFTNPIPPTINNTDAVCILSSTNANISTMIAYVDHLVKHDLHTKSIILLGGERYVTKNTLDSEVDGTEEELTLIARACGIDDWKKLTEIQLMQHAYNISPLRNKNMPLHIINTPARDLPRPTTYTTILELLSWLKNHPEIKHILFVSNQPYIQYQKAIIDLILHKQKINFTYQVIGCPLVHTETIKSIIESLGSYLWAATPMILSLLDVIIDDQAIQQRCKELYLKNPLMYQTIAQKFAP